MVTGNREKRVVVVEVWRPELEPEDELTVALQTADDSFCATEQMIAKNLVEI